MIAIKLTADLLTHAHAAHGFFTRNGGVSEGFYSSLNCGPGSKDNPAYVTENRRRAAEALLVPPPEGRRLGGGERRSRASEAAASLSANHPLPTSPLQGEEKRLCTLYQTHSALCHIIEKPLDEARPEGDAMVTNVPGIIIGILTADCAPVLFFDPVANIIGAAHAGWKGAVSGVIASTVKSMQSIGSSPKNILAAIGPCAGWKSYEVDPDFKARFLSESHENHIFFRDSETNPQKSLFNLKGYVASRLAESGVETINILANDTIAEEDFFSFRRTTHAKEPDYGRQLSAIVLR